MSAIFTSTESVPEPWLEPIPLAASICPAPTPRLAGPIIFFCLRKPNALPESLVKKIDSRKNFKI
jgi:hypothetical protein